MKREQSGFTLIELVMVIVILGVLSAVALPKFIGVDDDAKIAAANGVAGSLASASAINYASRKVKGATAATVAVTNCTDVSGALQGGLPTGYVITSLAVAVDASVSCTLTANTKTATFVATGIL